MCQSGKRVKVWNGDKSKYLGEGTMVGFVPVYIIRNPEGGISSNTFAEEKPEGIPDELIEKIDSNPKIVLDDGRIVYGCQTWWSPIDEKKLHYHDTDSKLKCPCCGKDLFDIKMEPEALEGLLNMIRKNPEDFGEILVGLFTVIHNPEKGTPVEELNDN